MSGDTCDVCGKPSVRVASSSLAPISWAFCTDCLNKPAEPLCMFAYLFDDVSNNGDGLREEINDYYTFKNGAYLSWSDYVKQRRETK